MSRTLDVLTDVAHGTVDGYRQGCRSSHCPAGEEHGLSCSKANTLAAGDWRYMKALRRGLTPAEIAEALDLRPTPVAAKPKRAASEIEDLDIEEEPMNTTVKPRAVVKPSQSEVRAWARENGIEVSPRGTLPRAIVDAYNARGKGIQASDVKPAPAPVAAAAPASPAEVTPEPEVAPEPAPKPEADEVLLDEPDWSLPLTASDLREIADALDAFEKLPRSVLQLEEVPVMRPGGGETIGAFRRAVLFDDDEWFGFVPRGGAA